MRISPIICFVDMLSIILRLVVYSIRERDFRKASELVMTQRYAYDAESADSALSEFRYNAPIRWISFLASVSQIVKLFALQGLIWTKVWAAMYLGLFLTVEIQVFVSRRWLPDSWPPPFLEPKYIPRSGGARSLPYISSALGTIFSMFFLISAVASAFKHQGRSFNTLDCTGIILLACSSVAFLPSSYYSYVVRKDKRRALAAIILLAAVILVPLGYLFAFLQHNTGMLSPRVLNYLVPGLIILWAMLSLSWASVTFAKAGLSFDAKTRIEGSLATVFFGLNLITALLFYMFEYDPTGTVKPAWTENLG